MDKGYLVNKKEYKHFSNKFNIIIPESIKHIDSVVIFINNDKWDFCIELKSIPYNNYICKYCKTSCILKSFNSKKDKLKRILKDDN